MTGSQIRWTVALIALECTSMTRSLWCGFVALIFVVSGLSGAYAQSTASISGVVKDSSGGVMPGVSVVVKNDTTGAAQDAVTDADGRYTASALGAGSYTITASLSGFKTAVAKGVRVAPGQPVSIPLTLEVGSLSETVN